MKNFFQSISEGRDWYKKKKLKFRLRILSKYIKLLFKEVYAQELRLHFKCWICPCHIAKLESYSFSVSSVTRSCPTLCDPMDCNTTGFPVHHHSRSLLKLVSIELVASSSHLILCRPLLFLPSIFPGIRVFSNESVLCIRWPKYWSFSFSINPSNEYSGLISFRVDCLDLAVQGTLKSLLQLHSLIASIP